MDNEYKKLNIIDFIDHHLNDPLQFSETYYDDRGKLIINKDTKVSLISTEIDDIIKEILRYTTAYASLNMIGKIETHRARKRSSIDIWRHTKFYFPDISIFDIMNGIWEIRDSLQTNFCSTVQKRVFRLAETPIDYSENTRDEYRLLFKDWEGINK